MTYKINDVGFIKEMVQRIISENPSIDTTKIYATGHSNGCSLSHRLAAEASDLFTGMGCFSHYLSVKVPSTYKALPMLEIHGAKDGVVSVKGAEGNLQKLKNMNSCTGSAVEENLGDIKTKSYLNCSAGTAVSYVNLPGQTHNNPHRSNKGRNMAEYVWEFLGEHARK